MVEQLACRRRGARRCRWAASARKQIVRKLTPVGTNWIVTTIAGLVGQKGTVDGTNRTARFSSPDGIALDSAGLLYVTDNTADNLRKLTPVGTNWVVATIGGFAGSSGNADGTGTNALFNYPDNIKVDTSGQLFIADRDNYTVRKGMIAIGPPLHISVTGNQAVLSWPTNAFPFNLEWTTGLPPFSADWTLVTNRPAAIGGNFEVTVELSAPQQFYRLRR